MNTPQTITADRLSKLLSAATGQPAEACDIFIREFFKEVEHDVATGGSATIPGLGTFIATDNATAPIEFKPDESLRATVNAPFEAFPEIELEDTEFDDSTVEKSMATGYETPETDDIADPITENTAEKESIENVAETGNILHKDDAVQNITTATENINPAQTPVNETPAPAIQASETSDITHIDSVDSEMIDTNDRVTSFCEKRRLARRRPSRCRMIVWMIIMLIVGFAAGMTAGYFFYYKINAFFNAPMGSTANNYPTERPELTKPSPQHTAPPVVKDTTTVHADTTALPAEDDAHIAARPDEKAKTAPEPKPARYDVVTNKIFLATLARKYYGQGDYWVYIYQANNLKHPDRIAPGTRLRIPYPEELPLSGNDSNDIKAARRLGQTIYARYR